MLRSYRFLLQGKLENNLAWYKILIGKSVSIKLNMMKRELERVANADGYRRPRRMERGGGGAGREKGERPQSLVVI